MEEQQPWLLPLLLFLTMRESHHSGYSRMLLHASCCFLVCTGNADPLAALLLLLPTPPPPPSPPPQARFLLCSETPQPSIRDLFGLGSLLHGTSGSGGAAAGQAWGGGERAAGGGGAAQRLIGQLAEGGEEACYAAARSAVQAAMDEADERALWGRFRVH